MEKKGLEANADVAILLELVKMEDLAEKKTKIYSRLLTDPMLAKEMERLSLGHAARKEDLLLLAGQKEPKKKNAGGMGAMNMEEQTK